LTTAAGERVDRLIIDTPFEAKHDRCRLALEDRPDAARSRLVSPDDVSDYVYPERQRV